MDKPQLLTVSIKNAAGQRNAEGDLIHQRVAPGTYRACGLSHDGIKTLYEFTIYSGGPPAWPNQQRTGGWLTDHPPPMSALFLPASSGPPQARGKSRILVPALAAGPGAPFVPVGTDGPQ